jgi:RES domain-containing protein
MYKEKTKGTFTISSKEIPTKSNTMACDVSSNNEFQAYSNIKLCVTQNRTNGQSVPTSLKSASTNVLLHQKNILLTTCCKTFKKQGLLRKSNCYYFSVYTINFSLML